MFSLGQVGAREGASGHLRFYANLKGDCRPVLSTFGSPELCIWSLVETESVQRGLPLCGSLVALFKGFTLNRDRFA